MSCLVEGRLSIRSYETKDGEKRKATEVVCNTMQMLDRANRGASNFGDGESFERTPAPARANGASNGTFNDDLAPEEEEIPF